MSAPAGVPVQFRLYQVSGTTLFESVPSTGGTLYQATIKTPADQDSNIYNYDGNEIIPGIYTLNKNYSGIWSVTFENLPAGSVDEKGKVTYYGYYVEEDPIEGYDTVIASTMYGDGNYSFEMTNRKTPKYTSITVNKSWVNKDGGFDLLAPKTDADAVIFDVYRINGSSLPVGTAVVDGTEMELSSLIRMNVLGRAGTNVMTDSVIARKNDTIRVTLTKKTDSGQWNDIKAGYGADQNANSAIFAGDGSSSSYSGTFNAGESSLYVVAGPGWVEGTAADLTVENISASSIQFRLTQAQAVSIPSATRVNELMLNKSNGWTATLSGLLAEQGGQKYTYFVIERNGEDYQAEYYYEGTTVRVVNREKPMLEVDKQWLDSSGTDITNLRTSGTITYDLYQVENAASWTDYTGEGTLNVTSAINTTDNTWDHVDLTMITGQNNIKPGSDIQIQICADANSNQTFTGVVTVSGGNLVSDVIDTYRNPRVLYEEYIPRRTITISNVTSNVILSGEMITNTSRPLDVKVLREPTNASDPSDAELIRTKVGQVVLGYSSAVLTLESEFAASGIWAQTGKGHWSSLIGNLPKDGPNNATYTYYVQEASVAGFDTTYSSNPSAPGGAITITNKQQPTGSLNIQKAFSGFDYNDLTQEQKNALGSITFSVTGPYGYSKTNISLASVLVSGGYTISGLIPGTYTVTENGAENIPGFLFSSVAYSSAGGTVNVVAKQTAAVTITNTYTPGVELPATGGPGTLMYIIGGLALILLAGVLLVSGKRKNRV